MYRAVFQHAENAEYPDQGFWLMTRQALRCQVAVADQQPAAQQLSSSAAQQLQHSGSPVTSNPD